MKITKEAIKAELHRAFATNAYPFGFVDLALDQDRRGADGKVVAWECLATIPVGRGMLIVTRRGTRMGAPRAFYAAICELQRRTA